MIAATTQLLNMLFNAFAVWLDNEVIKTLFGMLFVLGVVKLLKSLLQ